MVHISEQFQAPTFKNHINFWNKKPQQLRVVTFNYLPSAYKFATDWIAEQGHEHVLAITTPGPKSRPTPSYKDVLSMIPRNVNTLVTTRMRTVITPILHQLKPDIILCYSFPYRLTPEVCAIPTYGAVNIHPSVLPLYRGPNPMRQFYEGAPTFGSTAHRLDEHYDTGAILSQVSAPLPEEVTHNTTVQWGKMIKKSIAEGMDRAISGFTGIKQDDSQASYAAAYTEEERWISFHESTNTVLRKTIGLNLTGGLAKTSINGQTYKIHSAQTYPVYFNRPAGSIIEQRDRGFVMATADGAVKMTTEVFCPHKKYAHALPYSAFIKKVETQSARSLVLI